MILGAVILEGIKDEISVKKLLEWPTLLILQQIKIARVQK